MANREGVKRFCRVMAWLCVLGMVLLPVLGFSIWLLPELFSGAVKGTIADGVDAGALLDLSIGQRLAALAVMAVGVGLQIAALWSLRRTFVEGSHGRWFSLASVRSFRRFAWLSIVIVAYTVVQSSLIGLIATWSREGERTLSIGFGTQNFQGLFTALIMLFVAHMFSAGREVDEENAAIL